MLTAYPETITARLDDTMLERVTRMYKADAADAFAELLQNARRAGASHVKVDLTSNLPSSKDGNPEARIQVTVTDDGSGIDDPQVILAYGRNGWTSETTTSEDAAGMGLLALAAIGCNITSWSKGAAKAWQATLEPAHFQGQKPATIQTTKAPSSTSGTRITFTLKTSLNTVSAALQAQAEFFPLPIHLTCQDIPQPLTQRPFLDASKPSETYQGVAYAVMDTYRTYNGTPPKDLNFHGITLHANLPTLTDAWKHRYETCADVHECSALKLVLPGRKDVVENDFLHNLRIHLNQTLLQAISDDPNGDLTHAQYKRAKTFTTPVAARPQLHRWHPTNARDDTPFHTSRPEPLPSDAILIACDDEHPTAFDQSLSRVLRKHPLNLYKPNPYLNRLRLVQQPPGPRRLPLDLSPSTATPTPPTTTPFLTTRPACLNGRTALPANSPSTTPTVPGAPSLSTPTSTYTLMSTPACSITATSPSLPRTPRPKPMSSPTSW